MSSSFGCIPPGRGEFGPDSQSRGYGYSNSGHLKRWMNELMNGWMFELMNKQIKVRMNEWINELMNLPINQLMNQYINEWINE